MANILNVTSDDVDNSYEGTIDVSEVAWVERKIDEAVRDLIGLIPSIPSRITSGELDPELVKDKVVGAVLRVVRNPQGVESEGEGDYNIKLRNTVASGDIWWQEKDLDLLRPSRAKSRSRTVHSKATPGWGFPS